jgi:hypothetical protein
LLDALLEAVSNGARRDHCLERGAFQDGFGLLKQVATSVR